MFQAENDLKKSLKEKFFLITNEEYQNCKELKPEVFQLIEDLNKKIEKQENKLEKLYEKFFQFVSKGNTSIIAPTLSAFNVMLLNTPCV